MQFDDEDLRQFEKQFDLKRSDSDEAKAPAQKKARLDDREKLSFKRSYSKTPGCPSCDLAACHHQLPLDHGVVQSPDHQDSHQSQTCSKRITQIRFPRNLGDLSDVSLGHSFLRELGISARTPDPKRAEVSLESLLPAISSRGEKSDSLLLPKWLCMRPT